MFRKLSTLVVAAMMVGFFASNASAQFENQKNYAGVHIGLSGVGSALTLGLDYERGITDVGQVGPGIIGIGGIFDYYSYSNSVLSDAGTWTYIDIGVTGMYHFVLENRKWDPFLGIYIGDEISSWSWSSAAKADFAALGIPAPSYTSGGITLGGTAGIRYFFSDNWAAQARVGFGFYILAVGVDYKF